MTAGEVKWASLCDLLSHLLGEWVWRWARPGGGRDPDLCVSDHQTSD